MKDNILLIVAVLEGRYFSSDADGELLVEVTFGGESLATDPVPNSTNPKFDAELAWELDKHGLKLHRLQRSPVKLNCYWCNSRGKKENMGYLVLDIREAKEQRASNRWCRLLNSKYDKPELLLCLYLEQEGDKRQVDLEAVRGETVVPQRKPDERQQPTNLSVLKVKGAFSSEQLKPKLNSSKSYYQIGPIDRCTEYFALSVTLVFAEHLSQLLHGPAGNQGEQNFTFTYFLLGNSVTTIVFHNLTTAEFPAERATVRIRSNLDALYSYFKKEPGLQIQLLCNTVPIASTVVHLENLIESNHSSSVKDQMKVDGVFLLSPTSSDRQEQSDSQAAIGVSVVLQRELREDSFKSNEVVSEPNSRPTGSRANENNNIDVNVHDAPEATLHVEDSVNESLGKQSKFNGSESERDVYDAIPTRMRNGTSGNHKETSGCNGSVLQNGSISTINVRARSDVPSIIHNGKCGNHKEKESAIQNGPSLQNSSKATIPSREHSSEENLEQNWSTLQNGSILRSHSDDLQVHHRFHFILDLKSLQLRLQVRSFNCFLRYSYPFFGSSTAILTHPSVHVSPMTNVLLPHGYCSFDFLTSLQNIRAAFQDIPLMVEVLEELPGHLDGRIIGLSKICLHPVLESPSSKSTEPNGATSLRRSISSKVPVVSPDGKNLGELKIVAGLDDFGVADISEVLTKPVEKNTRPDPSMAHIFKNSLVEGMNARAEDGSENRLLHMMMELEVWKEQQEVLFRNQLKTRESEHLQTLSAEWKQRDLERELLVQRNLQECKQHEEKLKSALADIEVRERQLSVSESDLRFKRTEMATQMQKMKDEAKDNIRRIKLECDYKVELENKRAADLVQEKQKLQLQILEKDKKLKEKEQTIESLHMKLQGTSEIKLQAELEILNIEKGELNRKLEVVTSAKNRYKEQWGKALKHISNLQQQLNSLEKSALSNRLESLHLAPHKSVAVDEQNTLDNEKRALAKIKEEVDFLKRRMHNQSDSESFNSSIQNVTDPGSAGTKFNSHSVKNIIDAGSAGTKFHWRPPTGNTETAPSAANTSTTVADGYVQQLLDARDLLLNTGVYSKSDRIVSELEKHIEDSSARSLNI